MKEVRTPRQVLVTGASGFLGTALCEQLMRVGCDVTGISRATPQFTSVPIRWRQTDLMQDQECRRILEEIKPDYILHLAGLADGRRDLELILPTFSANAAMTVNLLNAASAIGCRRFIYCASMEEPDPRGPFPEPNSPYACSKMVGTVYCRMFHELYHFPAVMLRTFLVYGPGYQAETKLIPYIITSLLGGVAPQVTSGTRLIDLVYIDDVVNAFMSALDRPSLNGQVVDVGCGRLTSIREIADTIARQIGNGIQPAYGALADRPREMMPHADVKRSHELLEWTPLVSLEDGLQRTINWYRNRTTQTKD